MTESMPPIPCAPAGIPGLVVIEPESELANNLAWREWDRAVEAQEAP